MSKHVRPTIFDLERITGFSTGTISRAFNNNTKIKASTRDFVLQKAREIGYAPHSGARAMIQGKTRRWGLLLPHLQNPRYAEVMEHLDREARQRSTLLLLGLSHYDKKVEAELVLHWASGEVDGIISDTGYEIEVFEKLRLRHFPMVFLFSAPTPHYNLVSMDPTECSIQLMEMFIQAGHRRIGYISQDFPNIRLHSSYVAYQKVLAAHKIPHDESLVYFGTHDYEAGPQAWRQWRSNPRRPTAVLCFNDITACGLIRSAENDGYRVPHDLSVAGSDDIPTASFLNLTTIRTNPADIAREVFSLLEHPATQPPESRLVPTTIVQRNSIGPVPAHPK